MTKQRDPYLDLTKVVAIFMVLWIHLKMYAPAMNDWGVPLWMDNFCHGSLSMPLFFIMSGCFSRRMFESTDWVKLLKRMVANLWPVFMVIGLLGIAVRLSLYGVLDFQLTSFVRTLFSVGWFFWCLTLCETVTMAVYWLSRGRRAVLVIGLVLSYLIIWAIPLGLCHTVELIPFFWFGMFAFRWFENLKGSKIVGLVLMIVYTAICIYAGNFETNGLMYHFDSMHLFEFNFRGFALMLSRFAVSLTGSLGVFVLLRLIVEKFPKIAKVSWLGAQTAGVFFFHTQIFTIYFESGWFGWCGGGVAGRAGMSVLLLLLTHGLVVLSKWNRWVSAVLWNPLLLFPHIKGQLK